MSKTKSVRLHPHTHGPSYHDHMKQVQYFPLDELLFYVEHDSEPSAEEALNNDWLVNALPNEPLPGEDEYYQLSAEVQASFIEVPSVHFPASGSKKSFTIFCLRSDAMDVIGEFSNFYRFSANHQGLNLKDGKGIILSVLPNWFNGAAYHKGIGSHGPGGPPCPVTNPEVIKKLRISVKKDLQTMPKLPPKPGNVVVYILDTLPNKCRIQNALSTWPLLKKHFEKILDVKAGTAVSDMLETTRATYHYVDPAEFVQTYVHDDPNLHDHPYALGNHEYDSSDHGLFIAGIAHLFAPDVPLHVIQVMNDFGVGTFTNFANGFRKIVEIHQKLNLSLNPTGKPNKNLQSEYRAVVNCSFTLSVPIDEHAPHLIPAIARMKLGLNARLVKWIEANQALFNKQMNDLIGALIATLNEGAIVVAAAGNDSTANQEKMTRYPAKFCDVVGVGALKRDGTRAVYSNKNDTPPEHGVYVFGGDYTNGAAKGKLPNEEGVISIFTGNLNIDLSGANPPPVHPDIFDNPTGYAEWKGTSFSTPLLAGVLARISRIRNKLPIRVYEDDLKPLANKNTRRLNAITLRHS